MNPDVFLNPFPNDRPTSQFGNVGNRYHYGYDVDPGTGVAVGAPGDGWHVAYVGRDAYPGELKGNGNFVILEKGGIAVAYLHGQGAPPVEQGQIVDRDDVVLRVGNTGSVSRRGGSDGVHLHMEVLTNYDASAFPTFRSQGTRGDAVHLDPAALFGQRLEDVAWVGPGSRNDYVREVQTQLAALDLLPEAGITGAFDAATEAAVKTLQTRIGVEDDGAFGPTTLRVARQQGVWPERDEPRAELPAPEPRTDGVPEASSPPAEPPRPSGANAAFDTAGPFATTAVGDVLGVRDGTPLGALSADQSYAFGRAVLGDSVGAAALEFLDRELGSGDGVLVQRVVAMGLHEGQLHAGRANPDPASGYNMGTFQLGGEDSTPATTATNSDRLLTRGVEFLAARGFEVDRSSLTLMDRDVIVHVGYMVARTQEAYTTPLPEDQLLREMGDASITGAALEHLVHHRVQGGWEAIGESVRGWTDPRAGLGVDLAVVEARAAEPDAVRREPAMPTLDQRLHPRHYDTSVGPVTSPAVAQWQAVLQAENFLPEAPDGIFGDRTIAATRAAQERAGLAPDGVVGPDTWDAYAQALGRTVDAAPAPDRAPSPDGAPPSPDLAPPSPGGVEPSPDTGLPSLGGVAPEEYAVRQFDGEASVGTWTPAATQVAPSGDAARWVADTETPGDANVQISFPGAVAGELVARPGSTFDALLTDLARRGETVPVRTATAPPADGQPSTGTFALFDEATVLGHYPSVDAFVADIGQNGALQPPLDLGAARRTVQENAEVADLMGQVEGLVDNLLDTHTAAPEMARQALYDRARSGELLTADAVRDVLTAQTPPVTGLSTLEAGLVAEGVRVGVDLERRNPDVAAARSALDAADSASGPAEAPVREAPSPDRSPLPSPRSGGDGSPPGRASDGPQIVAPAPREPVQIDF